MVVFQIHFLIVEMKNQNFHQIFHLFLHQQKFQILIFLQHQQKIIKYLKNNKKYPRLSIPYIFYKLFDKVKEYDGKNSEGIFRLSIDKNVQQEYMKQIKQTGNVEINDPDPNIPAVLIKRLLDKLPPLLSCNFYQQCIDSKDSLDYQKIWDQLPHLNRQLLLHLSSFLKEMCEESVKKKKKKFFLHIFFIHIIFLHFFFFC